MEERLLKDYSDPEKGAYIGAITSIATADHSASPEEMEYIMELADSANLSEEQKLAVAQAANELTGEELRRCLDILKDSDLRFSLMTDLISFAESDKNYSEAEKASVEKIAQYLNINQQQFSLLEKFVQKTKEVQAEPEEIKRPGFLSSLGLDQKFKNSGINFNSVLKGLLGIAGPLLLSNMFRRRGMSQAGLNPFGQGLGGGRGLSSIISMLNGGRGFAGSRNMLSRMFGF